MKVTARLIWVSAPIILILCAGILMFEARTRFFRTLYDDVILDNRNHYLSCEQLPSESYVRQVLETHQDVLERIEKSRPAFVGVEINTSTCPGKADIVFWYGTHKDRLLIESIIAADTFYGRPYRLENR